MLQNKKVIYILGVLLTITFIIRITGLTFSPPGFFCDETSIGYNAYSIIETGKDEKGVFFPVFFKAFGDFKNPVYIYLAAIPIKILGLEVFSVRLTSALLGIGSILLFVWLLRIIGKSWLFALSGGLVMSLMPWHFQFSRIAFEAISMVFFIVLDMVFFALFHKTKKPIFYLLFGLSMVITFFTYSTGRLIVPLSAVLLAIIWRREIFKQRINFLISALAVALLGLILVYDHMIDPAGIFTRPHDVLIVDDNPPIFIAAERFFENYLAHLSPEFLFQHGDLNYRHSAGVSSMLLTSYFLPLLVGLVYFINRFKKSKLAAFLVVQFFLFPLASSITVINEGAQATRTIHIVPFLAIIITYGFWQLFKSLREKHRHLIAAILIFALFESVMFYKYYFVVYPASAGTIYSFNGGMPEAMEFAFSQNAPYYYISTSICQYRIEIPFFMKYPPEKFQKSLIIPNAKCIYPKKITSPVPGSVAVYKVGDLITHFPREKLLKTITAVKETVRQEAGTQRELYENKEIELYYIYRY
ncbi:MAG: phospholipid carrier-dependent glycosyltransferase [Candidatus Moranbacteria bacterium]|nr:phospholipid carrier-dependent glycosyltransferase [Candidatus Moranbacteria bacterium]